MFVSMSHKFFHWRRGQSL